MFELSCDSPTTSWRSYLDFVNFFYVLRQSCEAVKFSGSAKLDLNELAKLEMRIARLTWPFLNYNVFK